MAIQSETFSVASVGEFYYLYEAKRKTCSLAKSFKVSCNI